MRIEKPNGVSSVPNGHLLSIRIVRVMLVVIYKVVFAANDVFFEHPYLALESTLEIEGGTNLKPGFSALNWYLSRFLVCSLARDMGVQRQRRFPRTQAFY